MTPEQVKEWVVQLIKEDRLHEFYTSGLWLKARADALDEDKHECQRCKKAGKYERANTVHHVKPLKKYPELALSKTYFENGKEYRNFISLSHVCHELEDEAHLNKVAKKQLNEERW